MILKKYTILALVFILPAILKAQSLTTSKSDVITIQKAAEAKQAEAKSKAISSLFADTTLSRQQRNNALVKLLRQQTREENQLSLPKEVLNFKENHNINFVPPKEQIKLVLTKKALNFKKVDINKEISLIKRKQ